MTLRVQFLVAFFLVATVTSVVAAFTSAGLVMAGALTAIAGHVPALASAAVPPEAERTCALGGVWARPIAAVVTLYAYDPARASMGDAAADPLVQRGLRSGELSGARFTFGPEHGGGVAWATREGPCRVAAARWVAAFPMRLRIAAKTLISVFVATLVCTTVAALGPTLALLRRVDALRAAADGVGGTYTSAGADLPEELRAVSRSLDNADARIHADGERLRSRQHALECHIADIAHDVKTPLTALQLHLMGATAPADEAERAALLVRGLEEVTYIGQLVDDLRLWAELRERACSPPRSAELDLCAVVARVARRIEPLAVLKGVEVAVAHPDGPVLVLVEPILVEQAMGNLLQNAVVHGERGTHVALVLHVEEFEFLLTVQDDGRGLEPEVLHRLAQSDEDVGPRAGRSPGAGLGLQIVRSAARLSGWQLRFEGRDPRGLEVTIRGLLHLPGAG